MLNGVYGTNPPGGRGRYTRLRVFFIDFLLVSYRLLFNGLAVLFFFSSFLSFLVATSGYDGEDWVRTTFYTHAMISNEEAATTGMLDACYREDVGFLKVSLTTVVGSSIYFLVPTGFS